MANINGVSSKWIRSSISKKYMDQKCNHVKITTFSPINQYLKDFLFSRKFVDSILNPIQRLSSPDSLLESMTSKDAVVVAFVDVQLDKRQYKTFYQTAFKWLERDPYQEIGFGVVTGDTAGAFGVELVPSVRMYLWNETLVRFEFI